LSENLKDMEKQCEMLEGLLKQEKSQVIEDRRIKTYLIQGLKSLVDYIPEYPFYNKYKAIIAKTIIDLQYLT